MSKYLFAILILLTAFSCKNANEIKPDVTFSEKTDSVKADSLSDVYEGIYATNKHESIFQDCSNSNAKYWVIDESNSLSEQYAKMFEIPSVYNSMVVKVKGEVKMTENATKAEKFTKTLIIKEVISVEKKNYMNTCVSYDFWGLGNEPNWSLQISKNENLIEFTLPGDSQSFYFFYNEPVNENGYLVYRSHNQIQRYLIEIKIKNEPCRDIISDKVYEYSVEVELSDKRKFKGCGIKGKG